MTALLAELGHLDRAIATAEPARPRSTEAWPVLHALLSTTIEIDRPATAGEWTALSRILLACSTYAAGEAGRAAKTPASEGLRTPEAPPHYHPVGGGGS
jgi:hypothetical protein